MPELPEVETIARQLAELVTGRTIAAFTSDWERLTEPEPVPLVAARLAGRGIAGIGNICASEARWRARIHPLRSSGSLKADDVARLHEAIKWVLRKAIRLHGSTLRTYRDSGGKQGGMQHEFVVYDRAGEPCGRCGAAIRRTVIGGRSTYHCPRCQRAPRVRPAT